MIEFASSWKTGERQCVDPEPIVCPADETESVEAQNACNAIIDPLGEKSGIRYDDVHFHLSVFCERLQVHYKINLLQT